MYTCMSTCDKSDVLCMYELNIYIYSNCKHVYIHIYMLHVYMYVYVLVYMYMYMYTCICTCDLPLDSQQYLLHEWNKVESIPPYLEFQIILSFQRQLHFE